MIDFETLETTPDDAIHQLGIYRGEAKNSNKANHVVFYDQIKMAKSCKKIDLKNLTDKREGV